MAITERSIQCSVDFCDLSAKRKGMCMKHYTQIRRHGKIIQFTRYSPNEIIKKHDHCEVVLRDIKNKPVGFVKIDFDDLAMIKKHKWNLGNHGYAVTRIEGKSVLMHQFLNPKWKMTDHKDTNKINNRRSNLRECTHVTNAQNSKRTSGTSKFKGVCWLKQKNKWRASICVNKVIHYLGTFKSEIEAAKRYDMAAKRYFGNFAKLNFS